MNNCSVFIHSTVVLTAICMTFILESEHRNVHVSQKKTEIERDNRNHY